MKMSQVIIYVFIALSLLACSNTRQKATDTNTNAVVATNTVLDIAVINGTWELNYVSGPRIAFNGLYPNQKPTIIFALPSTEATGNTSCNMFRSKVTLTGNKISFGDPVSTRMACEGSGEQVFLSTLKKINRYNVTGDSVLTFITGDVAMMRFVKKR